VLGQEVQAGPTVLNQTNAVWKRPKALGASNSTRRDARRSAGTIVEISPYWWRALFLMLLETSPATILVAPSLLAGWRTGRMEKGGKCTGICRGRWPAPRGAIGGSRRRPRNHGLRQLVGLPTREWDYDQPGPLWPTVRSKQSAPVHRAAKFLPRRTGRWHFCPLKADNGDDIFVRFVVVPRHS